MSPPSDGSVDATGNPLLDRLFAVWAAAAGGGHLPARSDVGPHALGAALLPHVAITEAIDGGRRIRFRLCGTALAAAAGLDLTGRFVDELNPNKAYADYIHGLYRLAMTRGRPVYSVSDYTSDDWSSAAHTERLICPLAEDGVTVGQFIAVQTMRRTRPKEQGPTLTYAESFRAGPLRLL